MAAMMIGDTINNKNAVTKIGRNVVNVMTDVSIAIVTAMTRRSDR